MSGTFEVFQVQGGHIIKSWTKGVPLDDKALDQLKNVSKLPFIHRHVAVMPDCHWGMGATIGTVLATNKAIVPAAVGVDLGCGMQAVRTSLVAEDLPDSMRQVRLAIECAVPHGRTDNGGANDVGAWDGDHLPKECQEAWNDMEQWYRMITEKHPGALSRNAMKQLGTLGTGNHFIEVCLDEEDNVWVMLHSGSRGGGNRIGTYFIKKAKEEMEKYYVQLPDKDLAFLVEDTEVFTDYFSAVSWAQQFAKVNRQLMMSRVLKALEETVKAFVPVDQIIDCHHNYVERENHFRANVWVTRKGAVRARVGDVGIIPGSMGAKSFIVEGLGNKDSFNSCSHGAGRLYGRKEAKRRFTLEDHAKATAGVECRKDESVLDETPAAYKDIDAVMAAQADLVKVRHTLRQIVCVKG